MTIGESKNMYWFVLSRRKTKTSNPIPLPERSASVTVHPDQKESDPIRAIAENSRR